MAPHNATASGMLTASARRDVREDARREASTTPSTMNSARRRCIWPLSERRNACFTANATMDAVNTKATARRRHGRVQVAATNSALTATVAATVAGAHQPRPLSAPMAALWPNTTSMEDRTHGPSEPKGWPSSTHITTRPAISITTVMSTSVPVCGGVSSSAMPAPTTYSSRATAPTMPTSTLISALRTTATASNAVTRWLSWQ